MDHQAAQLAVAAFADAEQATSQKGCEVANDPAPGPTSTARHCSIKLSVLKRPDYKPSERLYEEEGQSLLPKV